MPRQYNKPTLLKSTKKYQIHHDNCAVTQCPDKQVATCII